MYFKFILSFILSLLVVACGDLGKEKVVNKVESTKFNAGCELKIDEFSKILEEPITDQIQCLGKSLDLFIQVVESGKPGYLSKTALETYVQKYVPEFKPENLEAIKTIFDVNHLVFGGEKDYISRESVKKLIDFLELFNKEIIYPYSLYKSEANVSYIFHDMQRKSIFKTADLLSKALLEIFNPDRGEEIHTINIVEVLEAFTTDDSSEGVQ